MDPLSLDQINVSENASVETNSENEIVQRTLNWFCFENDIKAVKKFEPEDNAENVNSLDQLNFDEIEIKREDGDDGKLECFVCNQKFDQYELELHFLECGQENEANNPQNEPVENVDPTVEDPITSASQPVLVQDPGIICPLCGKHVKSIEDLKLHLKVHPELTKKTESSIKLKFFACKLCGNVFKSKVERDTHISLDHGFWIKLDKMQRTKFTDREKEKKISKQFFTWRQQHFLFFSCVMCKKAFRGVKKCKRHVKKCEGRFFYSCHFCGRNFIKLELLKVSSFRIIEVNSYLVLVFLGPSPTS